MEGYTMSDKKPNENEERVFPFIICDSEKPKQQSDLSPGSRFKRCTVTTTSQYGTRCLSALSKMFSQGFSRIILLNS